MGDPKIKKDVEKEILAVLDHHIEVEIDAMQSYTVAEISREVLLDVKNGAVHLGGETPTMKEQVEASILGIANAWNWDNFEHEDEDGDATGEYWSVMQALYCKLSWVLENDYSGAISEDMEEHKSTLEDAMKIVEELQKLIKI